VQNCNVHPCPVDCVEGAFGAWSTCTTSCGAGSQKRSRTHVEPTFGGKACSHSAETRTCNTFKCTIDCGVGSWAVWSTCTRSCGGGSQQRSRSTTAAGFGGVACPHSAETKACNGHACAVDCELHPWAPWSTCTASCGTGAQQRARLVNVPVAYGGAACAHLSEARSCNAHECPVDCVMSAWTVWSACSTSCAAGAQDRTRTVVSRPAFGGVLCSVKLDDTQACTLGPCPAHCRVSPFSAWSPCTKSCGAGSQSRNRIVIAHAQNGGYVCPYLGETRSCNTFSCAVDCLVSEWGSWELCSKTCGTGTRKRSRGVAIFPLNGGVSCPPTGATENCNTFNCPVDCAQTQWGGWSACTQSCGTGTQARERGITQYTAFGGKPCGASRSSRSCNAHSCPIDCVHSAWSQWSTCTRSCGTGVQNRARSVATRVQHGGRACSHSTETRNCNTHNCALDCVVGAFGAWSPCSRSCDQGNRKRARLVRQQPLSGGVACPHLEETESCMLLQFCPVDCVMSEWSLWTPCSKSCGEGSQARKRSVNVATAHGGVECPALKEDYRNCNAHECPVDCVVSEWEGWTPCSLSCGGVGTQSKYRIVTLEAALGGAPCPSTKATKSCYIGKCPVHCSVSAYSQWSACTTSCGGGAQTRSRSVMATAAHGGYACPSLAAERRCNTHECPLDCKQSPFAPWSTCTASCGGGGQARARVVLVAPAFGGATCAHANEARTCNVAACAVDCVMAPWSVWSVCSKTCAGGSQKRYRDINRDVAHGGAACHTQNDVRSCNESPCPIDCVVSAWGSWSTCSRSCGGGGMTRTRAPTTLPQYGGKGCPMLSDEGKCNAHACALDCQLGDFGAWGMCSQPCGGGLHSRTKPILSYARFGGKKCPTTLPAETKKCNAAPCTCHSIKCQWSKHPLKDHPGSQPHLKKWLSKEGSQQRKSMDEMRLRVFHTGKEQHLKHHCKYDYVMDDCVCSCYDDVHFSYNKKSSSFERTEQSLAGAAPWWLHSYQQAARAGKSAVMPANVRV
jgi:hypothetical protein